MNVPIKVLMEMLKGAEYVNAKSVYVFVSKYTYEDATFSISFEDKHNRNKFEHTYSEKNKTLEKTMKSSEVTHIKEDSQ